MKVNVEIFLLTASAPVPEGTEVEFPLSMWFSRVPTVGEIIELPLVAGGEDLTLVVGEIIWTAGDRKPDAMDAEPPEAQFGEARAQLGCRVVEQ